MKPDHLAALAVLAGALAPAGVLAKGLNYNFVEVSYVNAELDEFDVDGDGYEARGSFAVTDIVHVFASYQDLSFDFGVDTSEFTIGAGLNWALAPSADLILDLGYINAEIDAPGPFGSVDDDGYQLGAGVRGRLGTLPVELEGRLRYVDLEDFGDNTTFKVVGRYYFTDVFALGAGAEFDDDVTIWNVGIRAEFAGR